MKKYTAEERAERHRTLMRERYRAGARVMQLEVVRELVKEVQALPYEQAVEFVQEHYRVKEYEKGE